MWGAVKKFDPGLRTYKKERDSGVPLSPCANNAKINTKVTADYVRCLEDSTSNLLETENQDSFDDKPIGRSIPKLLVVGGAIALACTLDQGLVTKAVVFGIARRFGKFGRRLWHVIHYAFLFVSCRGNTGGQVICGNRVYFVSNWQPWFKRNGFILFSICLKMMMQLFKWKYGHCICKSLKWRFSCCMNNINNQVFLDSNFFIFFLSFYL